MEFSRPPLVVAFELSETRKAIVADALVGAQGNDSEIVRLSALADLRLMISFECDGGHRRAMLLRTAL